MRRAAMVGLFAMGVFGSVLGPALPELRRVFGLSLADAGVVVVASWIGYIASVLASGVLADRVPRQRLLLAGALLVALGVAGFCLAPNWLVVLLGSALFGVGSGVIDGPGNAMVAEHSGRLRGSDLNLVHAFYGIGAVAGPLVAGLVLSLGADWRWLGVPGLAAAVWLVVEAGRLRLPPTPVVASVPGRRDWVLAGHPLVLALSVIICCYVGTEMMIGAWAFSYLLDRFNADPGGAGVATALFWTGLSAGRLAMGLVGGRVAPHLQIFVNGVGAAAALALTLWAPSFILAMAGLLIVGVALANIFPASVTIANASFSRATGTVTGLLGAAGGIGGAVFPWLAGYLGESLGLGGALASGFVLLAVLLLATIVATRWQRRPVG